MLGKDLKSRLKKKKLIWTLGIYLAHGTTSGDHIEDARRKSRFGADLGKKQS